MPDGRFYKTGPALPIERALALACEWDAAAQLVGDGKGGAVTHVGSPDDADLGDAVILCARKDIAAQLGERRFGLAIADEDLANLVAGGGPVVKTSAAKLVYAAAAARLHAPIDDAGEAPNLDASVVCHPTAVIGAGAEIGAGCRIGPHVIVGPGVKLGADCVLGPGSSVHFSILGDRVRLLSGVRLGEDGFGFAPGPRGAVRIPQLGRLIVGDDVEIGANAAIDRGALGDTVIGAGTKIDNLVHIAHNVQIGRNCFIAGQVGFAGSCKLGDGVMIGGQAGLADHISVGAGAQIAAQAGVICDMPGGESWGGTPAMPRREWLRAAIWAARKSKKKADEE